MIVLPRKNQVEAEQKDDGSYMASASDLMIGILFVFIIMVVLLALQVSKAEAESKNTHDPLGDLVSSIGQSAQGAGLRVTIDTKRGVILLPADILFDVGQSTLREEGKAAIQILQKELKDKLPCYLPAERDKRRNCTGNPTKANLETLFVEGHTDKKPLERGIYNNWHLGLDRARAVYELLSAGELKTYRNEREQPIFGFASYADERPLDAANDDVNRRVELRFVLAYKKAQPEAP